MPHETLPLVLLCPVLAFTAWAGWTGFRITLAHKPEPQRRG